MGVGHRVGDALLDERGRRARRAARRSSSSAQQRQRDARSPRARRRSPRPGRPRGRSEVPARRRLDQLVDARPAAPTAPGGRRPSSCSISAQRALGAGDVAGDAVGAHHLGRLGAPLGDQPRDEGRPERVDDLVGDDVATSSRRSGCSASRWPKRSTTARREVPAQLALEPRVVGQVGQQRARQPPLGVGEQHRELRALQAPARAPALGQLLGAGQELVGAVRIPRPPARP